MENTQKETIRPAGKGGLSGSTIKIIAVIAMLIDHAAATVLIRYLISGIQTAQAAGTALAWEQEHTILYSAYYLMRDIGRLGFPIFCFLLAEGFQRTKNVKKYALRLGMFALISEIPFNLAICGQASNLEYQNVYFTLLLGLLALCAFVFFEKVSKEPEKDLPAPLRMAFLATGAILPVIYLPISDLLDPLAFENRVLLCTLAAGAAVTGYFFYGMRRGLRRLQTVCADMTALALCMIAAELLRTDYAGMGVLTIAVMYLLRRRRALSMAAGCVVLSVMSLTELPAFFAVIPIALYNGRRGLKMKYFFYAFYPVHLALLYLTAVLLGLGGVTLL